MLDLKITVRPDKRRIDQLVEDLQYVSRLSFVKSLPLADFRARALDYLKSNFPESTGFSSVNEFGYHLVKGWKSELLSRIGGVGFRVFHQDEGNDRVETVLKSLNLGSRAFSYVADDTFHFYGKYNTAKGKLSSRTGWVTIAEGRTVNRGARPGIHYIEDTYKYIQDVLLPEMREVVRQRVKNRMERYGRR